MSERILKARDTETGEVVQFKWFDKADPTEADLAEIFKEHQMQQMTKGQELQVEALRPGMEAGTITPTPLSLPENL